MECWHERNLAILTAIGEKESLTQCLLAERLGVALGLTNLGRQRADRDAAAGAQGGEVIVSSPKIEYEEGFEDTRRRVPDILKLRARIGFAPEFDLDASLRKVIAYYRR